MSSLIFNVVEFTNQIKIFDFFQSFVRQLNQIMVESIQIMIMLVVMVTFWAIAFYCLEAN